MSIGTTRSIRTDIALLYVARGVRGLGDGFAIIILPAYLSAIGFNSGQIGIIASASLLGTALLTLAVGFIAPRCGEVWLQPTQLDPSLDPNSEKRRVLKHKRKSRYATKNRSSPLNFHRQHDIA